MPKEKAPRNRTIDTPLSEGGEYLRRCVRLTSPVSLDPVVNKTIVGDLFDAASMLPAGCADLIIADPPYNLTRNFGGSVFSRRSEEKYEQFTRQWLEAVLPLLKENGSLYVCCDWQCSLVIGRVLSELLTVRSRITWQREKGRGAAANWKNGMEDIWYAVKGSDFTFNLDAVKVRRKVIAPYRADGNPKDWQETADGRFRDTCPSNFWDDITVPFWSMPENTAHPTQKPEKLLAKLILASSNPGDLVLDPFLGSGSTSVTARKLGRRYIGIEQSEQYCVWAEQRLEMADSDPTIQGYTDGVFWERNTLHGHGK
ncbi:MAG: site-specific DNA-methyltransferase [Ruminococcaceae bacterium]|nr:site-specific DNA-methyltransferase [Oscillospiraceae bacterium]